MTEKGAAPRGVSPLLVRALAQFPGNSQAEFARAIGERRFMVWDWLNKTGYIPALYAIVVEKATGIPCREIVDEAYRRRGRGKWAE